MTHPNRGAARRAVTRRTLALYETIDCLYAAAVVASSIPTTGDTAIEVLLDSVKRAVVSGPASDEAQALMAAIVRQENIRDQQRRTPLAPRAVG